MEVKDIPEMSLVSFEYKPFLARKCRVTGYFNNVGWPDKLIQVLLGFDFIISTTKFVGNQPFITFGCLGFVNIAKRRIIGEIKVIE